MNKARLLAASALVAAVSWAAVPAVATSPPDLGHVVSETQATWTPMFDVGTWNDAKQVASLAPGPNGVMYACGLFSEVKTRDGKHYDVQNTFAFYATGASRGLQASVPLIKVNGPIDVCVLSPNRKSLFIGGSFGLVNGKSVSDTARVNLATGAVQSFASANGRVSDIWFGHKLVWMSGEFNTVDGHAQTGIATVHSGGKFSSYFHSKLSGTISARAGNTKSYRGVITTSGDYMTAIVNSSAIDGKPRQQIATWSLGKKHAKLSNWVLRKSRPSAGPKCNYMAGRGIAAVPGSPNDVVLSTTGGPHNGICDQTMRFSAAKTGLVGVKWTNYTKGDTSHSVATTTGAFYTQGHMKSCALLAGGHAHTQRVYVDHNGICALNPKTGNLLDWRSDQSRAIGGEGLTVTNGNGFPAGLWSAVDYKWGATSGVIFRPAN